jgi:hypothetical protein
MRSKIRQAACCLGLLMTTSVAVHAHGNDAPTPIGAMDCGHPPENALRSPPEPIDQWAIIDCSALGTKLIAAPGWQWRFPNSWFDRPDAPAWAPDASADAPGAKYFVAFDAHVLEGAEAAEQHARLAAAVPAYRDAVPRAPAQIHRLDVENNLGHEMVIWFPAASPRDLWAILCTPECRPDYAFIIHKPGP